MGLKQNDSSGTSGTPSPTNCIYILSAIQLVGDGVLDEPLSFILLEPPFLCLVCLPHINCKNGHIVICTTSRKLQSRIKKH